METLFLEGTDGHKIPVYCSRIDDEKFTVQIVHGLFDSSDRYFDLMEDLNKMGASAAIMDMRGHKRAIENASESLYLGEFNGWNNATDDIHVLNSYLRQRNKPNFLVGNGIGSDLLRTYALKYGHETDGIVLVSAGKYIGTVRYNIYSKILSFLISNKGETYRSKKIADKALKDLNKPFIKNSMFSYMTSDLYEEEKINKNPFMKGVPTIEMWRSILFAKKKIQDENAQKYIPDELPLLFVVGEKDTVGGGIKKQEALVDFYTSMGKNAELKIIKDGRFDLYHDKTKEIYLEMLRDFFDTTILQRQPDKNSQR